MERFTKGAKVRAKSHDNLHAKPHVSNAAGMTSRGRILIFIVNLAVLLSMLHFQPLAPGLNNGLALLIFISVLWFSEAMHITITALMVPILAVLLGVFDTKTALSQFAHPVIFLFLGGFALASALRSQKLDIALARLIIRFSGGRPLLAILLMLVCVAGLSMWISNTATAAMMLPMMIGLLDAMSDQQHDPNLFRFGLLGLAYSASLGGMATIVGSPPNAIAAAEAGLSFVDWMLAVLPVLMVLLPCALAALWLMTRPKLPARVEISTEPLVMDGKRLATLALFLVTVGCWIFSKPLSALLGDVASLDTVIALSALVMLALFRLLDWKAFQHQTDWGVLLLFGGGLTLSSALKATGTSVFLAQQVAAAFQLLPVLIMLVGLAAFVVFLTEVASNTASAALLVPLFASLAMQLSLPPQTLVIMVGVACSCAFMLPVATPPNAIVYGSGRLELRDFLRCGIVLNLLCSLLLGGYVFLTL